MFLASIASLALGQTALQNPVTYSGHTATIQHILAELGKSAGMELHAKEELAGEVLLVRVKDVPLTQLLDKIASVTDSHWMNTDKGRLLYRTEDDRKSQRERELRYKQQDLEPYVKEFTSGLEGSFGTTEAHTVAAKIQGRRKGVVGDRSPFYQPGSADADTAFMRAIRRCLARIPLQEFALLQQGQRVVYASHPTPAQKQLDGWEEILAKLRQEQQAWSEGVSRLQPPPEASDFADDPFVQTSALPGKADRAQLEISKSNASGYGGLRLNVIDSAGNIEGYASMWLRTPSIEKIFTDLRLGSKEAGEPIKLSSDSQMLLDIFSGMNSPDAPAQTLTPEFKSQICDPLTRDPLSYIAEVAMLAVGGEENLVAEMPDRLLAMGFGGAKLTPKTALAQLRGLGNLRFQQSDGWLTAQSATPVEMSWERMDRRELQTYLQSLLKNGRMTLDARATWSAFGRQSPYEGAEMLFVMLLDPLGAMSVDLEDDRMLRIYGSLTADQKNALRKGASLPFTSLSENQRTVLVRASSSSDWFGMMGGRNDNFTFGRFGTVITDPTVWMPHGPPMTGYFQGPGVVETVLVVDRERYIFGGYQSVLDPAAAGGYLLNMEKQGQSKPTKFRLGKRHFVNFKAQFTSRYTKSARLSELEFDPTSPAYSVEQLPADLKDAVMASLKHYRESSGGGATKVPPPNG